MARNFYKDAFAVKGRGRDRIRGGIAIPTIEAPVIEAINLRTDANEAARNATDQYEADVADFKKARAAEAEQGLASLPQFSNNARAMEEKFGFDPNTVSQETTAWTPHPSHQPIPVSSSNYSEEPDLSKGTDGQIALFGDIEGYGEPQPAPVGSPAYEFIQDQNDSDISLPFFPTPIDSGPRNIYTGQPLGEQYDPKSVYQESSDAMREWTQPMDPAAFGSAPGMDQQVFTNTGEPIFANRGGNLSIGQDNLLNKGLSRLPLNQQNDTLTQIFQSGFRPRR
jgi:hypothetical protein